MPMNLDLNLPSSVPELTPLTLESWKKGVITLIDRSKIPKDALIEMQNMILDEDGVPTIRHGVDWYGVAVPNGEPIDGAGIYTEEDGDPHLVAVAGGNVYRSTNNADTWTICTGATFTADAKVWTIQTVNGLMLTSGVDNVVVYDGTTTLVPYTAVATPGAITPTETASTVMAGTGYHHYYKVVAVNAVGMTLPSAASTDVQATLPRESWTAATDYVTLSISAVTNALRYDWYTSNDNIIFNYIGTTVGNASTTFRDDGTALANTNVIPPADNTTQGPAVTRFEAIGQRIWGVGDTDNPWRVWFSGDGQDTGAFAPGYNGGYIDLMPGSQFRPVRVVDYRDGKGTPYATVWCSSADGRGCIWQISLDEVTIDGIVGIIPSAYRLPGSRGTSAPDSVLNVLNDYLFFNSQAFYNLGSRMNLQQILSTDEISANIRPTIKQVTTTSADKIASVYFDALAMFSMPYGDSVNNTVTLYDTERKAWIPEAFTIGFERFLPYVQLESGERSPKLLAWKPGDNRLSQISRDIQGDYGEAFSTSLTTGLYPVNRDRFEFMQIEEAEVEVSDLVGDVTFELIGYERSRGLIPVKTKTLSADAALSNVGWSITDWSTLYWSDSSVVPTVTAEPSTKRFFRVYRELNAYQWRVTTDRIDARNFLRVLQLKGTATQGGKPRGWRLQ